MEVITFAKRFAAESIKNDVSREGDHYDEDGILICGVCGEPKRRIIRVADPASKAKDGKTPVLWRRQCRCDREDAAKKAAEEKEKDHIQRVELIRARSMLDEKYGDARFKTFKRTIENEKNFEMCRRYVSKFDSMVAKRQGLLFYGDIGTGKTYAAACIANELMENEIAVLSTSFVKVLEKLRSDPNFESSLIERMHKAKLVIFDDLGAERSTDYALEKVYNIVDSRYRDELPVIYTTNLDVKVMKEEPNIRLARIYDRIFETCFPIRFTGKSWRKAEASKRYREMKSLLEED